MTRIRFLFYLNSQYSHLPGNRLLPSQMKSLQFILTVLIIGFHGIAFGQSQNPLAYPYKITGVIMDNEGNPLSGVSIMSPGDVNWQISDNEGRYYAHINSPKTPVIFSCQNFSSALYCPDGRIVVDITLIPEKKSWLKRRAERLGHIFRFKAKKRKLISCP